MPTRQLQMVAGTMLMALLMVSAAFTQPMKMEKKGLYLNARDDLFLYSKLKDPTAGTFEEQTRVLVDDFYADAAWYGLKLGDKTSFVPKLSYRLLGFRYKDWTPNTIERAVFKPTNLHALKLHLMITHHFDNGWSVTAAGIPGIVSDFRNVDSDHWKIDGKILFSRMQNADLTYGFGAILDRTFGEMFVLPAVQLKYKLNEKSSFNVFAPKYAEYWNQWRQEIAFGLGIRFEGEEFTRGREIEGQQAIQPKGTSVRYSVGTVGPMCRYTLPNGWKATGSLGLVFARRYEIYDDAADVTKKYNLKETLFFRLTMAANIM